MPDKNNQKRILLYNRSNGRSEEETIFERRFMEYFYGTSTGLLITNLLIKRKFFSKIYGLLKSQKSSQKEIILFIEKYKVNIEEIRDPVSSFKTFNDFFKTSPD